MKLHFHFRTGIYFTFKNTDIRSSHCGSAVTNPTNIHEDVGSNPGLAWWVKNLMLLQVVV